MIGNISEQQSNTLGSPPDLSDDAQRVLKPAELPTANEMAWRKMRERGNMAKKNPQLICQHLENISRKMLEEYRHRQKEEEAELFGHKKHASVRQAKVVKPPDGKAPALLPYVSKVTPLRARVKGKLLRARVRRDGMIRFNGELYTSPSNAGKAAMGKPSCNGWTFWTYERAPGDWISLGELRKR